MRKGTGTWKNFPDEIQDDFGSFVLEDNVTSQNKERRETRTSTPDLRSEKSNIEMRIETKRNIGRRDPTER